ncbi:MULTISPECIES: DUF2188 domain-containing protein [unclassified Jeotgalibaca]|uniref:DUF2188 domain-containing protein n=1 Tax=unclassified Jeotgalibaca TaxID=2621505 RepID=UPI003FD3F2F8
MPWTEKDYPDSWKNLDADTRRKAIDIANAMLEDGYKDEDAIPIATAQAKKWVADATTSEKRKLKNKDLKDHKTNHNNKGPEYIEKDVHVRYVSDKEHWEIKTEGAERASETFPTKQEAEKRAKEIADKRDTKVISHTKKETES